MKTSERDAARVVVAPERIDRARRGGSGDPAAPRTACDIPFDGAPFDGAQFDGAHFDGAQFDRAHDGCRRWDSNPHALAGGAF